MSKASKDLIRRLRDARERLRATNINDPALAVCIAGLQRVEDALARPLSVVIVGEYNSGKTSVADLLIGEGLLPTSVVSNTHVPVLMMYAETAALYGVDANDTLIRIDSDDDPLIDIPYRALKIGLPIGRLRDYQILDTPSMVSPDAFVAHADIVIWCTVATRAWTESERATWTALPQRARRNGLLAVTHRAALQGEDDERHVRERLEGLTDEGLFQDIVLVEAAADGGSDSDGGDELRERLSSLAGEIANRRARKVEKIARRLARLTFHQFAREQVRPEIAPLLTSWELGAGRLLEELRMGRKPAPAVIEELLQGYAVFAEKLEPGVVTGDAISLKSASRALAAPLRWPKETSAATRLVAMLVSDLTSLLRMVSGTSMFVDPAVRADYQVARSVLMSLADLDGAFDALGRMVGSSQPASAPSASAV